MALLLLTCPPEKPTATTPSWSPLVRNLGWIIEVVVMIRKSCGRLFFILLLSRGIYAHVLIPGAKWGRDSMRYQIAEVFLKELKTQFGEENLEFK